MSADNCILILELKDRFIVKHISASDDLYWDASNIFNPDKNTVDKEHLPNAPVSQRVFEYLSDGKHFIDTDCLDSNAESWKYSRSLYDDIEDVEYGIQNIKLDKTWGEVIKESEVGLIEEINLFINGYSGNNRKIFIEELQQSLYLVREAIKREGVIQ